MKFNKKHFLKILLGILIVFVLFLTFLFVNNDIGLAARKLEVDIRSSQKIQDDWTVNGSVSDTMAAYISYPQDKSDHTFSIYVNRPGLSFGYFFRGGGSIFHIEEYITEFTIEGYNERAFISLNEQKVERLEIDNGRDVEVINIDCNRPFAIVLPINAGNIEFIDVNGKVIEYYKQAL